MDEKLIWFMYHGGIIGIPASEVEPAEKEAKTLADLSFEYAEDEEKMCFDFKQAFRNAFNYVLHENNVIDEYINIICRI